MGKKKNAAMGIYSKVRLERAPVSERHKKKVVDPYERGHKHSKNAQMREHNRHEDE